MIRIGPDILYALRSLRKNPGFALSALTILTLGIGANTAIFGIVNTVLLRPLPFPKPDAIVTVFHVPPAQSFPGVKTFSVSAANYLDWRKQNQVFEAMALIGGRSFRLGGGSRPQAVRANRTEPDFFQVLQVQPAYGRAFSRQECQLGHDDVAVLSDGFATRQFGSARNAVGRTLELDDRTMHVIGVMPAAFQMKSFFATSTDAWVPLAWTPADAGVRGNHIYSAIARLRPGLTVARAQQEMNVISERLARDYPEEDKGWGAIVTPVRDYLVGDVRPALLTLLGAVGFVLLIACANTANLVLARTIARRKELAIRAAMGASTRQVIRPVLVETTLLSLAGGALGLMLARSGQSLVINALADRLPQSTAIELDGRVLAFTLIASIVTGMLAGLIGCWRLLRIDLNESLKQGLGKTDTNSGGKRTRSALVVCEGALSLMLLVGAGLMVRSLWALRQVDPGFVSARVATMTVPLPARFYDEFLPRVRQLPGVVSAGAIDTLPFSDGGSQQPIVVDGRAAELFALQPNVTVRMVTPGYLQTMRIPLLAGRDFTALDTTSRKAVVLVSKSMAAQFWPGENPLGKHLRSSFSPDMVREVVGVVGDTKERGLDVVNPVSMLYKPLTKDETGTVSLVVRSADNGLQLVPAISRVLHDINPELPLRSALSMDELIATSLSQHRFSMFLFVALAALAFVMAAVGIYSVLAYSVRSRVTEISIRMALGAGLWDVLRLVVMEGMKPAGLGIVLGAVGAWTVSGILSTLIYGVSATDSYTFAAVTSLLAGVAFLACLIPAYRAARVEPVRALRGD